MSALAAELARVCFSIVREFGAPAVLTRNVTSDYDPSTSSGTNTPTNHDCVAAVFDYDLKVVDGSKILAGDRQAIIAARANVIPTPQPGDLFVWSPSGASSESYFVISSTRIGISGIQVAYDVQLRGGAPS